MWLSFLGEGSDTNNVNLHVYQLLPWQQCKASLMPDTKQRLQKQPDITTVAAAFPLLVYLMGSAFLTYRHCSMVIYHTVESEN